MRKLHYALLFFLVSLGFFAPARAVTLADLKVQIRRNIRDRGEIPSFTSGHRHSDAALLNFINEAQRVVINDTWASSDSSSSVVTANTTYYSIPSEAIVVWRVTLNNANVPELTLRQLDADSNNGTWLASTGTVTGYFFDRSSSTRLGLSPRPTASGTLTLFYYQLVPDLSSNSDIPFDGDVRLYGYHDLLTFYVSARILAADGRADEAALYERLYTSGIQVMNANVGHKPVRQLSPSKEQKP